VTHTVSLTVPATLRLTLRSAATSISPTVAQELAGTTGILSGPTITVISNRVFTLQSRLTTTNWTTATGATKAGSTLRLGFDGGAAVAMSTANRTLVTGGTRGLHVYPRTFTLLLNPATDRPGAYGILTRFTITAP